MWSQASLSERHPHPASSSSNSQPAQNHNFKPELTLQDYVESQRSKKKNPTTTTTKHLPALLLSTWTGTSTTRVSQASRQPPHPKDWRWKCLIEQTLILKHTAFSAQVDGGCVVSLWTANIALTLAEQMDLRSFYQHKLGPKCRACGPELQRKDCGDLSFWVWGWVKSWCSRVVKHTVDAVL